MKQVRSKLPSKWHAQLLDDYDQDHAMILGEGTKGLIYQAVMLKPPNVQPVYPIRDESVETRTTITLDGSAGNRKGPVIIFNAELQDPRSMMFEDTHTYFYAMMDGLNELGKDADVVVLHDPKKQYQLKVGIGKASGTNAVAVPTTDPFNVAFDDATKAAVEGRPVFWVSQCTA